MSNLGPPKKPLWIQPRPKTNDGEANQHKPEYPLAGRKEERKKRDCDQNPNRPVSKSHQLYPSHKMGIVTVNLFA